VNVIRIRLLDEPSRVGVEIERPAVMAGVTMPGWVRVRCDGEASDVLCVEENVLPEHVAPCVGCGRHIHHYDLRNDPKPAQGIARCADCEWPKESR